MKKHFKITSETKVVFGKTLFRIKATIDIPDIANKEDLGGFIEKEENLSGNAWVYGNASVFGDAKVCDDALVSGNAKVYDNALVSGNAWVYGNASVSGNAIVKKTKDYISIGPVGNNRFITATKSNKLISAGCFLGDIEEFSKAVLDKYGNGSDYDFVIKLLKEYFKSQPYV